LPDKQRERLLMYFNYELFDLKKFMTEFVPSTLVTCAERGTEIRIREHTVQNEKVVNEAVKKAADAMDICAEEEPDPESLQPLTPLTFQQKLMLAYCLFCLDLCASGPDE